MTRRYLIAKLVNLHNDQLNLVINIGRDEIRVLSFRRFFAPFKHRKIKKRLTENKKKCAEITKELNLVGLSLLEAEK